MKDRLAPPQREGHQSFTGAGLMRVEVFNAKPETEQNRTLGYKAISNWWHASQHDPATLEKLNRIQMPPDEPPNQQ